MGPPDSHGISRAPCYSGTPSGGLSVFVYRAVTLCGWLFHDHSTNRSLCNSLNPPVKVLMGPTTPTWHRHRAVPPHRFRLFPVRSPLLGESSFLSLPAGTEMFQFSAFPPHYAVPGHQSWSVTRSRRSSDHSLLSGFPKLIAAMLRPSSALDAKASTMHSL